MCTRKFQVTRTNSSFQQKCKTPPVSLPGIGLLQNDVIVLCSQSEETSWPEEFTCAQEPQKVLRTVTVKTLIINGTDRTSGPVKCSIWITVARAGRFARKVVTRRSVFERTLCHTLLLSMYRFREILFKASQVAVSCGSCDPKVGCTCFLGITPCPGGARQKGAHE